MKGQMKFQWLVVLGLMVIGLATSAQSTDQIESARESLDSLMIVKHDTNVRNVIHIGDKMKIWQGANAIWVGKFQGLQGDSLLLVSDQLTPGQNERWVPLQKIKRIKLYNTGGMRVLGAVFIAVGTGALFLGGVSLVAGTLALLAEDLGAIILVAVPVLGAGGFGLSKLGQRWHGKRYRLKKKWQLLGSEQ
jgi:hypothetical protein